MNESQKILDELVRHLGGVSDYRVAKELGVTPQAVSKWRAGRNHRRTVITLCQAWKHST
jgi:predicted transcriptional regulator